MRQGSCAKGMPAYCTNAIANAENGPGSFSAFVFALLLAQCSTLISNLLILTLPVFILDEKIKFPINFSNLMLVFEIENTFTKAIKISNNLAMTSEKSDCKEKV